MSFRVNIKTKKASPVVNFRRLKSTTGFTLLEILLVVGIISILAGIVIVAINPGRQLAQARNTERRSDIRQIKSAMEQFYIDKGYYPASTTLSATTTLLEVCDTGASSSPTGITCTGKLNLSELVPVYITAIPKDPQATTTNSAGYKVAKDVTNKLITTAPQAELSVFIAIGTSTPVVASTLGDGLVAHYLMNDTSGTAVVDTKGNNGTSARDTSAMSTTSGRIGNALSFNGSDYVTLANTANFATSSFSVSMWVYPTSFGVGNVWEKIMIANYDVSGHGWRFGIRGPNFHPGQLVLCYEGFCDETTAYVTQNQWNHVTFLIDGNSSKFYLNGSLTDTDAHNSIVNTSSQIKIGTYTIIGAGSFYEGSIDDVRIYNRVLTQDEIAELAVGTEAE